MPNLTSVHVTSGIPDAGTGTVSTIDELIVVGLPLTGGTVTVAGGNLTAVVSGTTFVSGGNVTSAINQAGAALSATNGLFTNLLLTNAAVTAANSLPVQIISGAAITAVISGTTFISGGNATAAINQGGNALSATNGIFANVLFNNALVSASVGLPVTILSGSGLTAVISGTTFVSGGNVTAVVSGTTFISGGTMTAIASGDVASGASDIGNPLKIGGLAKTANPTGVTDGQRVNGLFDVMGKMVVVHSIRALKANLFTTLPGTTSEITLLPAISTCFQDIYGCIIANTSLSSTSITFKDSTAGNSQFAFIVPAGDTRGFMLPESGAFKQTAQNTSWTITMGTLVTSVIASILYVKNTTA